MATYLQLLSLLLALSIFGDVLHIKDVWSNGGEENGNSLGELKYSLLLPGAESYAGLTKSAIKALKKLAKALAKKKGNARNKQGNKGHTKNKRPSTKNKHQKADARRNKEQNRKNNKG